MRTERDMVEAVNRMRATIPHTYVHLEASVFAAVPMLDPGAKAPCLADDNGQVHIGGNGKRASFQVVNGFGHRS